MAVTDSEAAPVIAKTVKQTAKDVTTLVDVFGVNTANLSDYDFYASPEGKNLIVYESDSDLRDTEKMFSTVLWHSNEARTCLCIVNFVPMKPSDMNSPTLSVPP